MRNRCPSGGARKALAAAGADPQVPPLPHRRGLPHLTPVDAARLAKPGIECRQHRPPEADKPACDLHKIVYHAHAWRIYSFSQDIVIPLLEDIAMSKKLKMLAKIAAIAFPGLLISTALYAGHSQDAAEARKVYDSEKSELCAEKLREAPAQEMGLSIYYNNSEYKRFRVSEEDSKSFETCLHNARVAPSDSNKPIVMRSDVQRIIERGKDTHDFHDYRVIYYPRGRNPHPNYIYPETRGIKYLYANHYQTHYLIDIQNKRMFELVRIAPPGTIEALGTWDGEYHQDGCKNSNGDPCGTTYGVGRTGFKKN